MADPVISQRLSLDRLRTVSYLLPTPPSPAYVFPMGRHSHTRTWPFIAQASFWQAAPTSLRFNGRLELPEHFREPLAVVSIVLQCNPAPISLLATGQLRNA